MTFRREGEAAVEVGLKFGIAAGTAFRHSVEGHIVDADALLDWCEEAPSGKPRIAPACRDFRDSSSVLTDARETRAAFVKECTDIPGGDE